MPGTIEDHAVTNRDDGSRWYVDPAQPELRYPSVTTVISAASSKPWLTQWAAKLAAEYAVDHLDTVAAVKLDSGREAAVDLIKGASRRKRDEAADIGSYLHDIVATLILGGPLPAIPDGLMPQVESFIAWYIDFGVEVLLTEATVCNPERRYAGTLDLAVRLWVDGRVITAIVDVKTGANIDATMAAQLSAYRRASQVWLPLGEKGSLPVTDAAYVLQLRPEGYRLLPVDTDARAFAAFLRMLELWHWKDEAEGRLVGLPVLPPNPDGTPQDRPLEHVLSPGLASLLADAGYGTCEQVAATPRADLLKIKGVGPGKLVKVLEGLAEVGLKLEQEVSA